MTQNRVVIYTDGACDTNPGPGGWAAILRYGRSEKVISGGDPEATNNRMELQAALSALRALNRSCQVTLYTDSEYVRRGITEWLPAWRRRGWRTKGREAIKNQDLWRALASEIEQHTVDWHWVRGHAGDRFNERVDRLARAAIPRPAARRRDGPGVHLFPRASCLGASGPGGWAVVVRRGDEITSLSGGARKTSANEMELQAAIQGLTSLTQPSRVHVYTVSKYIFQGATAWITGWKARGWRTKEGQPVRHRTLWLALQEVMTQHQVEWHQLPRGDRPSESEQASVLAGQVARTNQEQ